MRLNRLTVFEIGPNTYRLESLGRVNCCLLLEQNMASSSTKELQSTFKDEMGRKLLEY